MGSHNAPMRNNKPSYGGVKSGLPSGMNNMMSANEINGGQKGYQNVAVAPARANSKI
jgi:hypothetical protein